MGMTDIYSEVFSLESEETKNLLKDLARKYSISQKTFLDCRGSLRKRQGIFTDICIYL